MFTRAVFVFYYCLSGLLNGPVIGCHSGLALAQVIGWKWGRGLATLLLFSFMLRKKRGGNVYGICHGRYAAECNMITNKQTNKLDGSETDMQQGQ
jgi:hypothetical protein